MAHLPFSRSHLPRDNRTVLLFFRVRMEKHKIHIASFNEMNSFRLFYLDRADPDGSALSADYQVN